MTKCCFLARYNNQGTIILEEQKSRFIIGSLSIQHENYIARTTNDERKISTTANHLPQWLWEQTHIKRKQDSMAHCRIRFITY